MSLSSQNVRSEARHTRSACSRASRAHRKAVLAHRRNEIKVPEVVTACECSAGIDANGNQCSRCLGLGWL